MLVACASFALSEVRDTCGATCRTARRSLRLEVQREGEGDGHRSGDGEPMDESEDDGGFESDDSGDGLGQ